MHRAVRGVCPPQDEEKGDIENGVPISSCVNCVKHEHQLMMDHASRLFLIVEKPLDPEIRSFVQRVSFIPGRPAVASRRRLAAV